MESVWLSPFHRWGLGGTQALFQRPTAKRWQSWDLTPEPRLSTALTRHPSGCVQFWQLLWISGRWTGSDPGLLVEPVASLVGAQAPVTCSLPTKPCPLSTACDDSHTRAGSVECRRTFYTKNCNTALLLLLLSFCLMRFPGVGNIKGLWPKTHIYLDHSYL